MTLLETLLAVSLLSVLLLFIFGYFKEVAEISRMTEEEQRESFRMRYVESRLGFLFEHAVDEKSSGRRFFFYTESAGKGSLFPSLVLTFDNKVRRSPTFSGDVLGKLYVDASGRLKLAIWPLHLENPHEEMHEEVLMENVEAIRFWFYSPPEKVKSSKDTAGPNPIDPEKKTPEKDRWLEEWLNSYKQLPALVKVIITEKPRKPAAGTKKKKGEPQRQFRYDFVLPTRENYVYYPPGELAG